MAEQDQKDRDSSQNSENDTDYNKMIGQERQTGTTKGSGMGGDRDTSAEGGVGSGMMPSRGTTTDRDLGTVGGGTIPGAGVGTSTSPGGMSTSDSIVSSGGSTARSAAGAGATTDRGNMTNRDLTTNTGNTMDRDTESNLGGRNPSHPQTAMGDRDADIQRGHSSSTSPVQPMTSRDPSNRNNDQDTEKGS